jgi:ribosomal protein S14
MFVSSQGGAALYSCFFQRVIAGYYNRKEKCARGWGRFLSLCRINVFREKAENYLIGGFPETMPHSVWEI